MPYSPKPRLWSLLLVMFSACLAYTSSYGGISLAIERTEETIQGREEYVNVYVADGFKEIGGFDILMAYDDSSLNFLGAREGEKFYGDNSYQWEYFQYRFGPNGNCGTGVCPSGKLRVIGIAETNNGAVHPTGYGMIKGDVLFTMVFYVSSDRTLECSCLPIRFCWFDCGDNLFGTFRWDSLSVSETVIDIDGSDITDHASEAGYPTYGGAQDTSCDFSDTRRPTVRDITFINGGIHISCAETLDARGDINLNEIPYEIADAVLLINYFLYGPRVFPDEYPYPLSATDVNEDGNPLTVADLAYFIRKVTGDAIPLKELDTTDVEYVISKTVLSVSKPVGTIYLKLFGHAEIVNLSNLELRHTYDPDLDVTNVLIYELSTGADVIGDVLRTSSDLKYIEMATYHGAPVLAKQMHIPNEFVLLQNYPNPFNSSTVISFALSVRSYYELTIHNMAGQIVNTFEGTAEAGRVDINWDAADYASGVYFYRLEVGEFSESRKMILVK